MALADSRTSTLSKHYDRCLKRMHVADEKLIACHRRSEERETDIEQTKEDMRTVMRVVGTERAKLLARQQELLGQLAACHARVVTGDTGASADTRSPISTT